MKKWKANNLKFNISQQSIWKYENALSEPDIHTLIRFANYFNVSVDYLIGNTNIPTKADAVSEKQLTPMKSALIQNYCSASTKIQKLIFDLLNEITNF